MFNPLQAFRQTWSPTLGQARAAVFAWLAAVLVSGSIVAFVRWSPSPVWRRPWSSV